MLIPYVIACAIVPPFSVYCASIVSCYFNNSIVTTPYMYTTCDSLTFTVYCISRKMQKIKTKKVMLIMILMLSGQSVIMLHPIVYHFLMERARTYYTLTRVYMHTVQFACSIQVCESLQPRSGRKLELLRHKTSPLRRKLSLLLYTACIIL